MENKTQADRISMIHLFITKKSFKSSSYLEIT